MNRLISLALLPLAFACSPMNARNTTDPLPEEEDTTVVAARPCSVTVGYDHDHDGTDDAVSTLEYDDQGRLLRVTMDGSDGSTPDGTPESATDYTYDARGNLIETTSASDYEGVTYRYTSTMTYDDADHLRFTEDDTDGDGDIDSTTENVYDDAGNLVLTNSDWDTDGVIDAVVMNEYDEAGQMTASTSDYGVDGVYESAATFAYDDAGRLTVEAYDYDADGAADQTNTHRYDADGNEVGLTQDVVGDEYDTETTRTFDADANVLVEVTASPGWGASRVTNSYGPKHTMLTSDYDANDDGTLDSRGAWTYDDTQRLLDYRLDADANGTIDASVRWDWGC